MKILERGSKARKREAERGSEISQEYREIDEIMGDYMERREEEEKTKESHSDVDRSKADQDKAAGDEMRERAMERLAQTKKRNGKDEPRKKRQKSSETLDYLREAAERDSQVRWDELDMKRKQDEATAATQQAFFTQLRDQQQLQVQQQQQQQQQQRFMHDAIDA